MITWSPYAIVSMYSAFINSSHISPLIATLPAMFAKSSFVWSTLFFMFSNNQIRNKLNLRLLLFSFKKSKNQHKELSSTPKEIINIETMPNQRESISLQEKIHDQTIYWV